MAPFLISRASTVSQTLNRQQMILHNSYRLALLSSSVFQRASASGKFFGFSFTETSVKAFRRCSGRAIAKVGNLTVDVYYPTVHQLQTLFSPSFVLHSYRGVGVTVPPSYVETWMRKHPKLLNVFRAVDRNIYDLPGFRTLGDHVLLHFERVSS